MQCSPDHSIVSWWWISQWKFYAQNSSHVDTFLPWLRISHSCFFKFLYSIQYKYHSKLFSNRIALDVFRTTSTLSFLCEAFEPPMNLRRQQIMVSSTLNTLSNTNFSPKSRFILPLNKLILNISSLLQSIMYDGILISHHPINTIPLWIKDDLNIDFLSTKFHIPETNCIIFMRNYG